MTDVAANLSGTETPPIPKLELNKGLLVASAVCIGTGGILGMAGTALGSYVLMTATRQWVRMLDTPPREIARRSWLQGRAAGLAAVEAWRQGSPPVVSSSLSAPIVEGGT